MLFIQIVCLLTSYRSHTVLHFLDNFQFWSFISDLFVNIVHDSYSTVFLMTTFHLIFYFRFQFCLLKSYMSTTTLYFLDTFSVRSVISLLLFANIIQVYYIAVFPGQIFILFCVISDYLFANILEDCYSSGVLGYFFMLICYFRLPVCKPLTWERQYCISLPTFDVDFLFQIFCLLTS